MKKFIFLFFISFHFICGAFSQTQLVIEVTTDNYPDETYWTVYDLNHSVIKQSGTLLKQTTHRDTLILTSETCYYWTIYDKYSDGMSSAGGGDYKIYLDGSIVAQCENPNFGDSISAYNLGVACLPNDAALLSLNMLNYLSKESQPVSATLLNMGKEVITSVDCYYMVDNFTSATTTLSGLSIPVGAVQSISHTENINFESPGNYAITFVITKINGTEDSFTGNNSASGEVEVLNGIVQKNMVEMMTSTACSYCPEANERLDNALYMYPGTYSLAKYMVNLSNSDAKYIPENQERFDYYNCGGAPWLFMNGIQANPMVMTDEVYESNYLAHVTDLKMTVDGYMKGDSIFTTIKLIPMATLEGEYYLRGNAVQVECHENKKGSDYLHPVYGYLPNPEGILIQGFEQGVEQIFEVNGNIKNYPLEEGSLDEMIVNFFVQQESDKHIIQSENKMLTYTHLAPSLSFNIENGADQVDTADLKVVATSNRSLYQKDGRPIINIKDHLVLKKDEITGAAVPFTATLDESSSVITIVPSYGWTTGSTYYVVYKDFSTLDGIALKKDTLVFTTLPYIGVSENEIKLVDVYPTVVTSLLQIECRNVATFTICNSLGQEIIRVGSVNGRYVLPVNALPNGVYFLKVQDTVQKQVVKFLKQ